MISVDGLSKNFGDLEALRDVSFAADAGEVVGVLGLNGAGKSTLLRVLAGELTPSSGSVTVAGTDLATHARQLRAKVGFLPEDAPLYREMRVRDFLRFIGKLNSYAPDALEARVEAVAETTHCAAQLDRVIGELSMGFRKRVGIAQAILHEPAVVILDEPISALDPAEIVGMRELVRSLGGTHTVLVSSHILSEIHETCDRILMLHDGALVASGTEADLGAHLSSAHRVSLEVRGDAATVRATLGDDVQIDVIEALGDGVLVISAVLPEDRREAVVAALVAAGVGVRGLSTQRSDLEAVFLSMVAEARA